jgi:hypothetical protein
MAWIKRNLFFVIGGLVALGLLGTGGYYNYTGWSRNAAELDKLNEIYSTLKDLNNPQSSPGNDKINKIQQAKDQNRQLRDWLNKSRDYFQSIAPIPAFSRNDPITSEGFAAALHRTIAGLQREASTANVGLPPDYDFSFKAQNSLLQFSPNSLSGLAQQLGEVKCLSEILFTAGVNELDGIQRVRISDDDTGGPQSDYLSDVPINNNLALITPYAITFSSFGPEISHVLARIAASPHGFVVKSINIQPAPVVDATAAGSIDSVNSPYQANRVPGASDLVTVLKEHLLRVTMEIEIINLQPGN